MALSELAGLTSKSLDRFVGASSAAFYKPQSKIGKYFWSLSSCLLSDEGVMIAPSTFLCS